MNDRDPFDAVKRSRAVEAASKRDAREERERWAPLFKAVEDAAHFTGPTDLGEFSVQWAPFWWRLGEQIRAHPDVLSVDLSLPHLPEYDLAAKLLDHAIEGEDFKRFAAELKETILFLGVDDRVDALRYVFRFLSEYLQSLTSPSKQAALERNIKNLQLDRTDKVILRGFLTEPARRRNTPVIAEEHGLVAGTIGKNLRKLVNLRYLENIPRQGYLLTRKGAKVAKAISQQSP